jgi:hypothetical protein
VQRRDVVFVYLSELDTAAAPVDAVLVDDRDARTRQNVPELLPMSLASEPIRK